MCFGSKQKEIKPRPIPAVPDTGNDFQTNLAMREAALRERNAASKRRGKRSTILTSPLGITGGFGGQPKQLLGQ